MDHKLQDFGEKIGGARKDLYAASNINLLNSMNKDGFFKLKNGMFIILYNF